MTNPQENNALNLDVLKQQLEALCTEHHLVKFAPDEMIELIQDGEEVDWLMDQLLGTEEPPYRAELQQNLTNIKTILHPGVIEIEAEPVEVEELKPTELIIDGFSTGMEPVSPMRFTPEMLENLDEYDLPPELKVPGVSMDQMKEMLASPQGSFMMDFMTFCSERGVDIADLAKPGKGTSKEIDEYRAQWMETPREAFGGKTPQQYMEENPDVKSGIKMGTYRREAPKVGRNDPCPCGSGKKYKKCCGHGL
jgi:hypothetical protein